jgi:hypothetical protein
MFAEPFAQTAASMPWGAHRAPLRVAAAYSFAPRQRA